MLEYIYNLPVEVVGRHVLDYLDVRDLVWLERACSSRTSRQLFLQAACHFPAVSLDKISINELSHTSRNCLWLWLSSNMISIKILDVVLPGDSHQLCMNLRYDELHLKLRATVTFEHIQGLKEHGSRVTKISIDMEQGRKVMEQLSKYTPNVAALHIRESATNTEEWLTEATVTNCCTRKQSRDIKHN